MALVLMPVPGRDSDPTEVAVTWKVLTTSGHQVRFATPSGRRATCDPIMVTGQGLDPWAFIPRLRRVVVVGRVLRANADARAAYAELVRDPAWRSPMAWADIRLDDFDGLFLPGGHRARGMREYLESPVLQALVVRAFGAEPASSGAGTRPVPGASEAGVLVAAICHGVVLAARSIDPARGRSVLYGRRTTALTWSLERSASRIAGWSRFWDRSYYRTYPEQPGVPAGYRSVQQEVTRALASPADFLDVPADAPNAALKRRGLTRDRRDDDRAAFVVEDGDYFSARWPGDAHTLAARFGARLKADIS